MEFVTDAGRRSMPELARRWSELLLADVEPWETVTATARMSRSLLRPPATEPELQTVEERLGRALPPSYREFLLVSDGAYGDLYGASTVSDPDRDERPSPESAVPGVGFLPAGDLRWLRSTTALWDDLLTSGQDEDEEGPAVTDGQQVWPWTPFRDGLLIGVNQAPGTTCLVPFDGNEEWQVWNIHFESCEAHLSFRSLLERMVYMREPVTTADEARTVISRALARDHAAIKRLSRTTAPDALPLLVDLVTSGAKFGIQPALGIGRIGTAPALEALARLRPEGAAQALLVAGDERARDLLAQWGCYYELSQLRDPRAFGLAARHLQASAPTDPPWSLDSAIRILSTSADSRYVPALLPLLTRHEHTATMAAYALARLGAPQGRQRLTELAVGQGPEHDFARHLLERPDTAPTPP